MKLSDMEKVQELQRSLENARGVLAKFESAPGPTVPAKAYSHDPDFWSSNRGASVMLLPVPKEIAVSAAKRDCVKIVNQLRELGVEVDDGNETV